MDLNMLFFPAPKSSYTAEKLNELKQLIWVPRRIPIQEREAKLNKENKHIAAQKNNQQQLQKPLNSQNINKYQNNNFSKKKQTIVENKNSNSDQNFAKKYSNTTANNQIQISFQDENSSTTTASYDQKNPKISSENPGSGLESFELIATQLTKNKDIFLQKQQQQQNAQQQKYKNNSSNSSTPLSSQRESYYNKENSEKFLTTLSTRLNFNTMPKVFQKTPDIMLTTPRSQISLQSCASLTQQQFFQQNLMTLSSTTAAHNRQNRKSSVNLNQKQIQQNNQTKNNTFKKKKIEIQIPENNNNNSNINNINNISTINSSTSRTVLNVNSHILIAKNNETTNILEKRNKQQQHNSFDPIKQQKLVNQNAQKPSNKFKKQQNFQKQEKQEQNNIIIEPKTISQEQVQTPQFQQFQQQNSQKFNQKSSQFLANQPSLSQSDLNQTYTSNQELDEYCSNKKPQQQYNNQKQRLSLRSVSSPRSINQYMTRSFKKNCFQQYENKPKKLIVRPEFDEFNEQDIESEGGIFNDDKTNNEQIKNLQKNQINQQQQDQFSQNNTARQSYNFMKPNLMGNIHTNNNISNNNFCSPRYNKYFNNDIMKNQKKNVFMSQQKPITLNQTTTNNTNTNNNNYNLSTVNFEDGNECCDSDEEGNVNITSNTITCNILKKNMQQDQNYQNQNQNSIQLKDNKFIIQQRQIKLYEENLLKNNHQENKNKFKIDGHIPCIFLKSDEPSPYVLVYFHGNGEDIYQSFELLDHIRINLNINIIALEYPGYGIYEGEPSDIRIQEDSEHLYEFLIQDMKLKPKQIILLGRSIGSGSATYLASQKKIGALILVSAFTSLRGVVEHLVGKLASYLINERFDNLKRIQNVKVPILFIHGEKDKLVPCHHSQKLSEICKVENTLNIPPNMNHTEFDFTEDLVIPIYNFLLENGIDLDEDIVYQQQQELFNNSNNNNNNNINFNQNQQIFNYPIVTEKMFKNPK